MGLASELFDVLAEVYRLPDGKFVRHQVTSVRTRDTHTGIQKEIPVSEGEVLRDYTPCQCQACGCGGDGKRRGTYVPNQQRVCIRCFETHDQWELYDLVVVPKVRAGVRQ